MNIFSKNGFFKFQLVFLQRKVNVKFPLASLTTLTGYGTNSQYCSESRIKFQIPLSFSLIGRFQSVNLCPACGTIFRITGSFRNNFLNHWRLSKSLKKLSKRFSQLVRRNFILDFLCKKIARILETMSTQTKITISTVPVYNAPVYYYYFDFQDLYKKNNHLVPLFLGSVTLLLLPLEIKSKNPFCAEVVRQQCYYAKVRKDYICTGTLVTVLPTGASLVSLSVRHL